MAITHHRVKACLALACGLVVVTTDESQYGREVSVCHQQVLAKSAAAAAAAAAASVEVLRGDSILLTKLRASQARTKLWSPFCVSFPLFSPKGNRLFSGTGNASFSVETRTIYARSPAGIHNFPHRERRRETMAL